MLVPVKYGLVGIFQICMLCGWSQTTIPWSSSLYIHFGQKPGLPAPLPEGTSDLQYTTNTCPPAGYYTVTNRKICASFDSLKGDAGHLFTSGFPSFSDEPGYLMLANFAASTNPLTIFSDTVKNLCDGDTYLFWAGIRNISMSNCFFPNFTFSVETTNGQLIQSARTGDIGGADDKAAGYPFYYYWGGPPPGKPFNFPYYGCKFSLPAGIRDVVVKIIENPSNTYAFPYCNNVVAIDNIILSAVGPNILVGLDDNPNNWVTSSCYKDGKPIILHTSVDNGYYEFGEGPFISSNISTPTWRWQQSNDGGYSWSDIPGETSLGLSHVFPGPDTFLVRLRGSENININNNNCSVFSNVIKVEVDGPPAGASFTSNSPICTDSNLEFFLSGGASYLIWGPNGYSDNIPFPHISSPSVKNSGIYYAQIISAGGCTILDSIKVVVRGPNATVTPDTSICSNIPLQLIAGGGTSYTWSPPDGLSATNISNPIASPIATTKYQVKVTDQSGCSKSESVTIRLLNGKLKAAFAIPGVVCPGDIVNFTDNSVGKIVSWNWDFGNGQQSEEQEPPAQKYVDPFQNTNYPIKLVVVDSSGCADTTLNFLKVVNNCHIQVPNAFTPNGDGHNDYLYPLNAWKATQLRFRVYNRFGQVVFESTDWTKKWDGTLGGKILATGTYVWTLEYLDEDKKHVFVKGTTVLIR